jgi:hypothetical protein
MPRKKTTLCEVNTSEKFEKNREKKASKDLTCVFGIIRKSFFRGIQFL